MNGLQLFRLGRQLMKLGEEAIPKSGFQSLPTSVRFVLMDVIENPDSSVGEITARTGFLQSHVSAAVAKLRDGGALITEPDPKDRRRTIVRPSPQIFLRAAAMQAPIEGVIASAMGTHDPIELLEVTNALESLAARLMPQPSPAAQARFATALRLSKPADFAGAYSDGPPPWDIGRPQPAIAAHAVEFRGRFLDAGCGTGEHALLAAGLGLEVLGIDSVPQAIAQAELKARERNLIARFQVWDALRLAELGMRFDTVVDSGLFHVFDDEDRAAYVSSLAASVDPGGRLYVLCFSEFQPGTMGPRRVTRTEIEDAFATGWRVDSIAPASIETTGEPVEAWLASITRL